MTLPERRGAVGGLERHQGLLRRVEDQLRDAGVDEAITWSFVAEGAGDACFGVASTTRFRRSSRSCAPI